jgi:hypothetical protein
MPTVKELAAARHIAVALLRPILDKDEATFGPAWIGASSLDTPLERLEAQTCLIEALRQNKVVSAMTPD